MENILSKYLYKNLNEGLIQKTELGPVITVSRDYGCEANVFAQSLVESINFKTNDKKNLWKFINKEILDKSAQELHLNPLLNANLFTSKLKAFMVKLLPHLPANII